MANAFLQMNARIASLEARLAGMVRHGPVEEVNTAEGWVRLNLGEGDHGPLLSPKIPYAQMAGGLKVHAPPTKGQNMTVIAPGGDPRQSVALPMTWSDQNAAPASGADPALTFGDVRIDLTAGGLRISVGGVSLDISGAGVAITGGQVTHDGLNIGSTHRHGGVQAGPATTDFPV